MTLSMLNAQFILLVWSCNGLFVSHNIRVIVFIFDVQICWVKFHQSSAPMLEPIYDLDHKGQGHNIVSIIDQGHKLSPA